MSSIRVVPYDFAWPRLFEKEKELLFQSAQGYIEAIEHVGSTSIPGLDAKPIIDLLVGLCDLAFFEQCIEPLARLGYAHFTEKELPGRHFFFKPDTALWTERTHQIHLVEVGNPEWRNMLLFRNYLRDHPRKRQQYACLKHELADTFDSHPAAYSQYIHGKAAFVHAVL